jgi:ribosome biogenesis GTPase
MQGRIVKGIAGFYYVYAEDRSIYECKAKGIFRKDKRKPMVGDRVLLDVLDAEELTGNITELEPRDNELIRPMVANVDQALIVFALTDPDPDYLLLDKLLLQYRMQDLPVIICFNKEDLGGEDARDTIADIYRDSGSRVLFTCAVNGEGVDELKELLKGKLSFVAGPSGVGKSSLINSLQDSVSIKTGNISRKLKRGKHTTRHSEIIPIEDTTFIMDTPGFSKMDVFIKDEWELKDYYNEFFPYENCRFKPCSHTHEPDCGVKDALDRGLISGIRYDNYSLLFSELKESHKKY